MTLHPDNEYVVVLDACVLAPMPVCDTLLRLATDPALYQVRWSVDILLEVERYLARRYTSAQCERRLNTMRQVFPEAMVEGYQSLTTQWDLPDPADWHVMAAAIRSGAQAIVTANLKHFPQSQLLEFGILVQHPDDFLLHQFHLNPGRVRQEILEQASARGAAVDSLLQSLENCHPKFISALRSC